MTEEKPPLPAHSIHYAVYFSELTEGIDEIYKVAEQARAKGYDPTTRVEIPPAHDVAGRVEATLDGPLGVAKRIRELQEDMSREEVAFEIAKEIALGNLGDISDPEKAADKAVRVALAILTESITAAPLEGIAKVMIRGSGPDRYLAIYLAGPIRAAGGTEAAVTVLVADYVRQVLELPPLKSTEEEVERALEEVELYARAVHLQYPVHPEMIRLAASRLPIMLTGEPTEEFEVSAGRDLERIETNRVRGGSVLVLNDGVVGRAAKLAKIVERLKMPGWEWLDELAEKTSKPDAADTEDTAAKKLAPKSDYLADVIGGRPVFSHPSRIGGFRLRYGRSRNTGLAGVGTHPATMFLVNSFLAPGTHIRTERPGKGSIVAPVDTIEGPTILLKDGTVKRVYTADEARELESKLDRILYLGDILVGFGEFLENNHPLVPSGYCEEWWSHDLELACSKISTDDLSRSLSSLGITEEDLISLIEFPLSNIPSPEIAVGLAKKFKVPLHPTYLYRWRALTPDEVKKLIKWIHDKKKVEKGPDGDSLILPNVREYKTLLERTGIPHTLKSKKRLRLTDDPVTILAQIGTKSARLKGTESLEMMNSVSKVRLKDRLGFSIGARMGRPEKAEARKMRPPIHALFPVGRTMASERRLEKVAKGIQPISTLESFVDDDLGTESMKITGLLYLEMVSRLCPGCGAEGFESKCTLCGSHTEIQRWCAQEGCGRPVDETSGMCPLSHDMNLVRSTKRVPIDIKGMLERVKGEIKEPQTYGVRGVLGLTSDLKIPEYLGKGILRAKHEVYSYRDGTARFDATDAPLTHFTPYEIGVPVNRIRELGYATDYLGNPLTSDTQVVELKVQDLVIPDNCAEYLIKVGSFVDDCLEKIYGLDRYYNFKTYDDILGQLVIGLAPHTSAGIVGRIIGFTNASLCYAHPYWHAAKRRNCIVGKEEVLLLNSNNQLIVKEIASLEGENLDDYRVLSVGENGDLHSKKIQDFVKLSAPDTLYNIRTKTGRDITVTADHKMVRFKDGRTEYVESRDLEVGDSLLTLAELPDFVTDDEIDIIDYYSSSSNTSNMRVHGAKDFLKKELDKVGGCTSFVRGTSLNLSGKALWGYIDKDSIPLDTYLQLVKLLNLDDDYESLTLSYRKTAGRLPIRLMLTKELGELAGLYLSDGHSRTDWEPKKTKFFYQVSWSTSEKEVADRVIDHCMALFSRKPSVTIRKGDFFVITLSGRIFFELFRNILSLGSGSKDKRADKCINFSRAFKEGLLGGFIQGDGYVGKSVKLTSSNRQLLNHIALVSLDLGLFPHLSNSTRTTSFTDIPVTIYSLRYYSRDIDALEPMLFASRLKRQREHTDSISRRGKRQKGFGKYNIVKISEIKQLENHEEEYVYDFVIEGENKTFIGGFGSLATYDCDGDEDAILLVLDALINFSKSYLPAGRGGFMDAPLVLSVILNPREVDDESHNIEICDRFPAQFYELTDEAKHPKVVEKIVDIVASRLGTEYQYEGFSFTHGTSSIDAGPRNTKYKTLGSMIDKLDAQLQLAQVIDAVDTQDVAERVLSHHFIRDIRGNLRAYSTQKIQCLKCHRVYRRIPLTGQCTCGAKLSLTVRQKNISKYLDVADSMIRDYGLDEYLQQRIRQIKFALDSLFVSEQTALADFFDV